MALPNPRDFDLTKEDFKNTLQVLIAVLERNNSNYSSSLFLHKNKDPNRGLILKTAEDIFKQNFGSELNTQVTTSLF